MKARPPQPTAATTPARRRNDAIADLVLAGRRARYLISRLRRLSPHFYPEDAPASCVWDGKIKPRELNANDWRDIAQRADWAADHFRSIARRAADCADFAEKDPK